MDIFVHAAVGAATGQAFGHPVVGAVTAVIPDVVLGPTRRTTPNAAYNATHSVFFVLVGGLATLALTNDTSVALCVLLALLSHIALDVPTHGTVWAPTLFYPFLEKRYSYGNEWEFFNRTWWRGLMYAIIWSLLCLL